MTLSEQRASANASRGRPGISIRFIALATAVLVAVSMIMLSLSRPSSARAQTASQEVVCYVIADGFQGGNVNNEGLRDTFLKVTGVTGASPTAQVLGGLGGMTSTDAEAMALRRISTTDPTKYTLWGWERQAGLGLFTIDPTTGATVASSIAVGPTGTDVKVEGMTFALDDDADLTNDQLWFSYTPDSTMSSANQLAGYNINTGALIAGPFTVSDATFNSLVDIAFDSSAGVLYGVLTTNADLTELVTIDPASGTIAVIGTTVLDLEGLSAVPGVGLYGTTGNDNDNALYSIDPSSGTGSLVVSFAATETNDQEAVACVDETPLPTPTPTPVPTATAVPTATETPAPTGTAVPPTPMPTGSVTPAPTGTPVAPTGTPVAPTATAVMPTGTAMPPTPTGTPAPTTPTPTGTAVPPTPTGTVTPAPTLTPEALDPTPTGSPTSIPSPTPVCDDPDNPNYPSAPCATPTPVCGDPDNPSYPDRPCATPTPTATPTCSENPGNPNDPNNPCVTPTPTATPSCVGNQCVTPTPTPGCIGGMGTGCPTPTPTPMIVIKATPTPIVMVKPTMPPPPPPTKPGLALTGTASAPLTRLAISIIMAGTIIAVVSRFYAKTR